MLQKRFFTLSFIVAATLISLYSCKKSATLQPGTIKDIDGNIYHTITIEGAGTWTVENARMSRFRDGTPIRNANTQDEWVTQTNTKRTAKASDTGAWCYYNNTANTEMQKDYGKLYNWYAVKDARGLAPTGWHVATAREFEELSNKLGDSAGHKLKAAILWPSDPLLKKSNRNSTGFTALPAGMRYGGLDEVFLAAGQEAYFWSSTEHNNTTAVYCYLRSSSENIFLPSISFKTAGYSVRFVKDR